MVGGQRHTPAALPLAKRLGTHVQKAGLESLPVWTVAENSSKPGFYPWSVRPVASRCTGYPILVHVKYVLRVEWWNRTYEYVLLCF